MSTDSIADDSTQYPQPFRTISDSLYLVIAVASLWQAPHTFEVSGWFMGICYLGFIAVLTGFIARANTGRFRRRSAGRDASATTRTDPTLHPKPLRYPSDSLYLLLAGTGLVQTFRTIDESDWITGVCFAVVIVGSAAFIGLSNRGRFISLLDKPESAPGHP